MDDPSKRRHLRNWLGAAAMSMLPLAADAAGQPRNIIGAVPLQGVGHRIKHLSYSDQGGKPDGVQIMVNRRHVYVGHMFNDGVTVMDASDPRKLKPVNFWSGGEGTRTHQMQNAEDILLVANGANTATARSYDGTRGYFESNLADIKTKRKNFRAGVSIHDISRPGEMREIAFLEMPGLGVNRIGWQGGRYAYVSAHFDGFTDHILCVVDLQNITKPEIVAKWWLPGMNRAAGETPANPPGKRYALHHMLTAGNLGYGAWRDGGFTVHDVSDPVNPKFLSRVNWSPPFPGGTHTPMPLPKRQLAVVVHEANGQQCEKGVFRSFVVDMRAPENPVVIATLPAPSDREYCASPGTFGPHNVHENRPGSFQSEELIFGTHNNAGVRVYDLSDQYAPKEVAYWVPPVPNKLVDPRPGVGVDARTADLYVTKEGLMYVSDWNAGMHVLEYQG